MSERISKIQLEVWEVKERLSAEVEKLDCKQGMHALLVKAARTAEELKKQGKIKIPVVGS